MCISVKHNQNYSIFCNFKVSQRYVQPSLLLFALSLEKKALYTFNNGLMTQSRKRRDTYGISQYGQIYVGNSENEVLLIT